MFGKIVLLLAGLGLAAAQIPSLGFCPDYVPMANFNMNRFLGVWYEAERYFQLSEVVSRCVMANYTRTADGKYRVSNEVTNRFTGIKRVLDGEIKPAASKAEEGKLHVKYTTIPLAPETKYSVLETDYDSYAVLWSCSGIGPFHTQNAWLMTRERLPPGTVLQKAYGVLDKYKISKTFFVKTDQEDCAYLAANPPSTAETEKPSAPVQTAEATDGNYRSSVVINTLKEKDSMHDLPKVIAENAADVPEAPVESVPERILKISDSMKEELVDSKEKEVPVVIEEEPSPKETIVN